MNKMKKTFKTVSITVSAVILIIVLALNIAVGVFSDTLDKFVVGYKKGAGSTAARSDGAALSEQIQAEGTVLVENKNEVLPLNKTNASKVNVFGWASTDWVISGSGSGQVKRSGATDFLTALKDYGIEYNTALTNMYENFRPNREFSINGSHAGGEHEGNPSGSGSLHSFNYEFSRLYEPSISDSSYYTETILNDAKEFSDTAIVVIGRVSGESNDSPKVQYKKGAGKTAATGQPSASETDANRTYLEISSEEEELLKYVGANYDNVVVIINSTNVMELTFMRDIPGLDACLIAATTGSDGAKAIPKILYGEVNPSGRLADTYAYDLSTSSTYVDTGSGNDSTNFYTNGSGLYPTTVEHTNGSSNVPYYGVAYTDYREGVYLGYKWYETADTMGFWESSYAKDKWNISNGYDDVVQYPFGYGLSYPGTEFTWEITYLEHLDNTTLKETDTIEIDVRVTNTGTVAGQDVVELYYSAPYTENGIEKSSVNLAAFGKTINILEPGEHEDVVLELKASDMASYDYQSKSSVVNNGGYVLEKGDYTLTLRTDAHTLAGDKVINGSSDTITYKISADTRCDENVENRFTGTNTTDGVAIDGNSDGSANITYLSRTNFAGTFPGQKSENREMADSIKNLNLYTSDMANEWAQKNSDAEAVTFGDTSKGQIVGSEIETTDENGNKVKYYALNEYGIQLGLDYDNAEWENLLDRITKDEMVTLVLNGYTKTSAVASIGKPETLDLDGPNQISSFRSDDKDEDGNYVTTTGFSSIVLAQTWNLELAYSMGLAFGKECAVGGIRGWYGPGVNLHRSPFGGRNYEYYSEDALISGLMCAKVVAAAKNRGVFCYLKHMCLYETESGRDGMYTWVTEQALRELYLKPFEIAVKEGGSTAIMTSYGRIGAVWTGGSEALLSEVATEEWGFRGAFLTDYSDHAAFMNTDHMIRAGGDLFMTYNGGSFSYETTSNAFNQALRSATKDLLYMWMNALATNAQYNESSDDIVIPVSPELNFRWYIPVLIVVDVIAVAGCGVWIFLSLKKKKEVQATV